MTLKPQGFPFLFYGREPAPETASDLRYAVELADGIAFGSGQDVALDEAFRAAVQKETECTANLFFDARAPNRLNAVVTAASALEPSAAFKLVLRGLLAVHGIAPIVECVHLASGGRGRSPWDQRSRDVRESPSADLLAFSASTRAGDPSLASAAPTTVAPPEPALVVRPIKDLPRAVAAPVLEHPDAPLAYALEQGSKVSVSADGQRAVWYAAGVIAERPAPGAPSRVLADLGPMPAHLGRSWADAAIVDDTRVIAVAGRAALLLVRGRGLHHVCSIVPLGVGLHRVAARGSVCFVGSALDSSPDATLRTLRVDGRALVPIGEENVSSSAWGRSSDIHQLDLITLERRSFCIASFSNEGRVLRTEGRAELLLREDLERAPGPDALGPVDHRVAPLPDPETPEGATVARALPDGGLVALHPTLSPVSDARMLVPMLRRVLRHLPDGSTREWALPTGAYTSLALSPDGRRVVIVPANGHGQQRLVVDVASGEVLSAREAIGGCAAFLDDDHVLVGSLVERWSDGAPTGRIAGAPWQAAIDRERQMLIVLDLDGTLTRYEIDGGALLPLGRFAAIGSRPAGLRERGRRVEQLVHGQWLPVT